MEGPFCAHITEKFVSIRLMSIVILFTIFQSIPCLHMVIFTLIICPHNLRELPLLVNYVTRYRFIIFSNPHIIILLPCVL
jgi:hypothetical protein